MRKSIAFIIILILALAWTAVGQKLVPFFDNGVVKAAAVSNISDTISDSRRDQLANHLIAFTTVSSIDPADTVVIKFDDTGNAFDLSSLSPVNILDFDFSVDGIDYDVVGACADNNDLTVNTNSVTDEITFTACAGNTIAGSSDIRIEIGANATFGGNGVNQIRNPSSGDSFFIDIAGTFGDAGRTVIVTIPSSGIGVSVTIGGEISPPGSGGAPFIPLTGNLRMAGKAYPNAFLTILKNGQVAGTQAADNKGNFEITIKSIPSNQIYKFGIYASDDLGLSSPTLSFNLSINTNQITEVVNIYFPPTIALSSGKIIQGDKLKIYGSTYPENLIVNFILPRFFASSFNADEKGHWIYYFDSGSYAPGEYFTRAKSVFGGGEQTDYSDELSFIIESAAYPFLPPASSPYPPYSQECAGADLNGDSRVDLVDFSILMYYWEAKNNPLNQCVDINQDGNVDIYDFSIMMYYWTE